jgi:hypothetical protein
MPDLDDALRTMLRVRAQDVTSVPAHLTAPPLAQARRRSRWPVVATVGAVAAVAVGVVVLRDLRTTNHTAPPVAPASTCTASLPAQWRDALSAPLGAQPVAAAPDGSVIATSDQNFAAPILQFDSDGHSRVVFTLPHGSGQDGLGTVTADGRYLVVPIEGGQGATADYGPGVIDTQAPAVTDLLLVDSRDGSTKVLARMTRQDLADATNVIDSAALQDGHVYWDLRPSDGSRQGTIEDYDLASGTTSTAFTGTVDPPFLTARGVEWGSGGAPAQLPAIVKDTVPADATLETDGQAYAYATGADITWLNSDGTKVGPLDQHVAVTVLVRAVAGPIVFFTDYDNSDRLYALDTRTGGVADLGIDFGGNSYAGGGVFAGVLKQNENDYPQVRLDTSRLPELTC